MNTIIRVLVLAISLVVSSGNAQDFQGVATYKSKRKVDIKLDSTQVNSEMHQRMMEMMKKQFEKTYNLSFNKEASIYKEEESLAPPQPAGVQVVMFTSGGADILFKNFKEQRYVNQNDVFGKIFLVKDKLKQLEWKLESETKNIGDYTCFKATTTREQAKLVGGISINRDKDLDADADKAPEMETITITAWYTPQIPVTTGPGNYHGLPGLILEVNDGTETVICSKIVLNPQDAIVISEPKKGKIVSQAEFDDIVEKKMKEMREQRNSDRKDGHQVEIRIGG
ncbi:GLPGLI family protein [Flavobacteriaceae bacterium MAR_2010_72]|nr:GLPGLI family protein [Flavobacteriaceae bacterium MAR_2010_72]TVZ58711.1 GLPGLI family protein [Flavobacteriaceae bacterium MAR_2010_105]